MSDTFTRQDPADTRVAVLEAHTAHIREDVAELRLEGRSTRADLASLKADVGAIRTDMAVLKATMASKGFVVAVVVGTGAVISAITALAPFLPRLLGLPH